jgi:hypothetical protein
MKYSGIDLHSNNSVVVVSDEADRVLVRRRLADDPATNLRCCQRTEKSWLGWSLNRRTTGTGWWMPAGGGVPSASGEHGGDQALRGTQAQQ